MIIIIILIIIIIRRIIIQIWSNIVPWVLLYILIIFYSYVIKPFLLLLQKYEGDELFTFVLFYIYFALLLVQLTLTSFAEKIQRRGYQELGRVRL